MSIPGMLFQCASTVDTTKHVGLIQCGHYHHFITCNYDIAEKFANFALNNNHSLTLKLAQISSFL